MYTHAALRGFRKRLGKGLCLGAYFRFGGSLVGVRRSKRLGGGATTRGGMGAWMRDNGGRRGARARARGAQARREGQVGSPRNESRRGTAEGE